MSDDLQKKNEDSQRKIFSKNLKRYIGLNNKSQIDICKDLGINPTTFNMWCTGKSIPGVGKISKLATLYSAPRRFIPDSRKEIDRILSVFSDFSEYSKIPRPYYIYNIYNIYIIINYIMLI